MIIFSWFTILSFGQEPKRSLSCGFFGKPCSPSPAPGIGMGCVCPFPHTPSPCPLHRRPPWFWLSEPLAWEAALLGRFMEIATWTLDFLWCPLNAQESCVSRHNKQWKGTVAVYLFLNFLVCKYEIIAAPASEKFTVSVMCLLPSLAQSMWTFNKC